MRGWDEVGDDMFGVFWHFWVVVLQMLRPADVCAFVVTAWTHKPKASCVEVKSTPSRKLLCRG